MSSDTLSFEALYGREGLVTLDARFCAHLAESDVTLHAQLMTARARPEAVEEKAHSQLLIDMAPYLEDFIAALFGIEKEMHALRAAHHALAPLYACKRLFVQRRAARAISPAEAALFSPPYAIDDELAYATGILRWLENEEAHKKELEMAMRYAAWALYSKEGKARHRDGVLFKQPHKTNAECLVPVETEIRDGVTLLKLPPEHLRQRHGFMLTDPGGTLTQALDHAHYCIYCHHQGKDSCAKGMREKDSAFKKSALNIPLTGCPLEEKISEMNELKSRGVPLGALAVACVDNPMLAGTGHRICNDCMKSCIYQKQEPVNIPLLETRVLKDILELPWGFEIYSLLTRWNPLNIQRPLPKPDTGKKVLVAGMGPAGYTLAHHLLNDGHTVAGIDGLKIEPLPEPLRHTLIRDVNAWHESLDARVMAGFGGVAEYGITVRWDKNYLRLIRLLLERRKNFALFGSVRFGGQITYESAFALGFDHIALALGAGRPTLLDIPGGMARGVRTASDFLMGLQLTGAARNDSIANLQLRLPAVVIGGGLTAIDAATEALAYYPIQVEKFLTRYEALVAQTDDNAVRAAWSEEETHIAEEFLTHARALRTAQANDQDILPLLQQWGGVTILYRKRLIDSPAYRLNHEEMGKALEEGIAIAPLLEPESVEVDAWGHARAILCREAGAAEKKSIAAKTILVAAGTQPNTVLAREDPQHFQLDGRHFRAVDAAGNEVAPERSAKPQQAHVLMNIEPDGRAVSFFGDLHPSFAGNVVKAMASAKQGYPAVTRILARRQGSSSATDHGFLEMLRQQLTATVHAVHRLTPTIVEVVVHAPLAARIFRPGQFFKLQNFESFAASDRRSGALLAMEPLALTGAQADAETGLISLIVLEMGGSSRVCAYLKPGEPVALMGPCGTATEIPRHETVLLAGGGLGNAVLFSIGKACRKAGTRVLYFAAYRKKEDRYKTEEIEAAADTVVWCCEEAPLSPGRSQDLNFHGNIVEAMAAYGGGRLQEPGARTPISLSSVDRIIAIGSDRMMAAVAAARHSVLEPYLKPGHAAVGSINSPMQCMMKEICAQCVQMHQDPATGARQYVYSCFNQDQCLDRVDFSHLSQRLAQNGIQEKLTDFLVSDVLKSLCVAPQGD